LEVTRFNTHLHTNRVKEELVMIYSVSWPKISLTHGSERSYSLGLRTLCWLITLLTIPFVSWSQEGGGEAMKGWYAGGGVGISNVYSYTDTCYGCWGDADYGESDFSFTVTGGYRFMPYVAVEVSYLDSGTPEWDEDLVFVGNQRDVFNVDAEIDLTSYQLNVLGIFPFARIWEVYLRGGMAFWDAESQQLLTRVSDGELVPRKVDESGADFLLGVGGGVTLGDRWQIRLDYAFFAIDDDLLALGNNDDAYLDFVTLQLLYRIGENW